MAVSLERFHDVAALWSAGFARPAEVVLAACDVLADPGAGTGADGGGTLAMLAGLSTATADDTDVGELLEQALGEVGLAYHPPGSDGALEHAVAAKARELLAGAITPRALARWAHQVVGHDRLPQAEGLVLLDDAYDYEPGDPNPLDDDVPAEAATLAAGPA